MPQFFTSNSAVFVGALGRKILFAPGRMLYFFRAVAIVSYAHLKFFEKVSRLQKLIYVHGYNFNFRAMPVFMVSNQIWARGRVQAYIFGFGQGSGLSSRTVCNLVMEFIIVIVCLQISSISFISRKLTLISI